MSTRYSEPTLGQPEEAKAHVFLAETQRELRKTEHIHDLQLELDVIYTMHNQTSYRIHASRNGQAITDPEGHNVHPANGTPATAAWHLVLAANSAKVGVEQRSA